ncbi:MAG: hypothetical protein QM820_39620 [Minicystis sp.]
MMCRLVCAVVGFTAKDLQTDAQIEAKSLVLGFLHDERLEGREVVWQQLHRGAKQAFVPELAEEKVDGEWQLGGREHFLANGCQHLLGRDVDLEAFAERKK